MNWSRSRRDGLGKRGPRALDLRGLRAYVADWYEMFPDFRFSFEDITDAGPGRVIAVSRIAGTARASGVPTELRFAVVWTIRDGKIVRGREYWTMDEAC